MTVLNVLPVLTILTASTVLTVFIVLAEYFEKHDSLLTTDNLKASISFMQNSGRGWLVGRGSKGRRQVERPEAS